MPRPENGTTKASRHRQSRKARGLCPRCGGPPRLGMVTCGPCSASTSLSGFTFEERERKKIVQGGVCSLCQSNPCTDADHCHSSGIKRDMLCRRCNMLVGVLEQRPWLIDAAYAYVERHREEVGH